MMNIKIYPPPNCDCDTPTAKSIQTAKSPLTHCASRKVPVTLSVYTAGTSKSSRSFVPHPELIKAVADFTPKENGIFLSDMIAGGELGKGDMIFDRRFSDRLRYSIHS